MTSSEIRKKFLDFFEAKEHKVLPSSSLVPRDDSSVLFTTAGMQQFRRFYAKPSDAPAARVVTVQKCLRTSDIEEVGDSSHLTFFEMLGNFSFGWTRTNADGTQTGAEKEGAYFKKEAIEYAWDFLVDELEIPRNKISATYFDQAKVKSGVALTLDEFGPDIESKNILEKLSGLKEIKAQGEDNFWTLGTVGSPGGPTVEFYIDGVEVWNLVFNEIIFKGSHWEDSEYKGVDTGMGLERLVAVMQEKDDVFETDLFWPIVEKIEQLSGKKYQDDKKSFRIIADHLKAATFLLSENIIPSNKDQGYITRRLIRRSVVKAKEIGIDNDFTAKIAAEVINCHPELSSESRRISEELNKEEDKFRKTLSKGLKELEKLDVLDGKILFDLYQTYGLPAEVALEEVEDLNVNVTDRVKIIEQFQAELKHHQEKSRTASAGMFKGGLADAGEETTKLHTAAHLMLAAMRQVLGGQTEQKGSNITVERLRFDFNYPEKLTAEQIKQIEDIVNKNIEANLPVTMEELTLPEAKASGATGSFSDRYGDKVKVYTIGPSTHRQLADRSGSREEYFSREICGGPHVKSTGELGHFKITKEQSSSSGVRRIKAILE